MYALWAGKISGTQVSYGSSGVTLVTEKGEMRWPFWRF